MNQDTKNKQMKKKCKQTKKQQSRSVNSCVFCLAQIFHKSLYSDGESFCLMWRFYLVAERGGKKSLRQLNAIDNTETSCCENGKAIHILAHL